MLGNELNNGGWNLATTTNRWTNWLVQVTLAPGSNTLQAFATDVSGNVSTISTVTFDYVVSGVLTVNINGGGTVVTNYNGTLLQIGRIYSMTAKTNTGFAFSGWTGSITTNNATLEFVMASNLVFNANFVETARPTLAVTAPANAQKLTNALAYVKGTAKDDWGVQGVWLQLNGNVWILASTTNAYTNWNATLTLVAGTNLIKACARNLGGNYSATNSLSVVSSTTFHLQFNIAPRNSAGLTGETLSLLLSTNLNGQVQVSTDLINWVNWGNFAGTNSPLIFQAPAATNSAIRFYRAVIP